jgi:hypothetical protein
VSAPDEIRDTGQHQFFADPAVDTLARIVVELAAEVWVQRDQLRTLEQALSERGTLPESQLAAYQPSPERYQELMRERDAFVQRLFAPILTADESSARPTA